MLRIRVKMGPARNKEWTCCFGLHVRTATIMIGLWHLFLNLLALGVLAVIIQNPKMMNELENGYDDFSVDAEAPPALPTPLSKIEPPYPYRDHSLNYHNIDTGGLVCICMIAITLTMVYGAVNGRPSHLLPFFCLQLFDFAITTLTAAGYLCYLRSVHRLIDESHRMPWREELLKLSPQTLSIVVLLAFVSIVLLKAYAIGIVWRCYKYLTMRQHNLRSMLPYVIPDVIHRQERDYSSLLPDYEEAIAQGMKQPPPPSYQVAMAGVQQLQTHNIPTVQLNSLQQAISPSLAATATTSGLVTATAECNQPPLHTVDDAAINEPPPYFSVQPVDINATAQETTDTIAATPMADDQMIADVGTAHSIAEPSTNARN